MPKVSLNVDLGELAHEPEELYALATQVNVACGGHAGDEASMARAVELASAAGARVAAHPAYPDRAGFGRASLAIDDATLARSIAAQCAALARVARARGVDVKVVKPHGALYHDVHRDRARARAFLEGVRDALGEDVAIVGYPGSPLAGDAAALGMRFLAEAFADRGYASDGTLIPRGAAGAMIEDPSAAAAQALRLAPDVDTRCVHGDTRGAAAIARAVRDALAREGLLA